MSLTLTTTCPCCKDRRNIALPVQTGPDDYDTEVHPCPVCRPWQHQAFPGLVARRHGERYYIIEPAEQGEPATWNGYAHPEGEPGEAF